MWLKIPHSPIMISLDVNPETSETTYLIPRPNGDVVLGGTFQVGNWDVRYVPGITRTLGNSF